jgi:DNA-binding CsgD family transcriptional regulator
MALDLIAIGVMVTNCSGEVQHANRTAKQFLAAQDGLDLTPRGVLFALQERNLQARDSLQRAIQGELPESIHIVSRPSGKRSFTLFVRSLHGTQASNDSQSAAALVLILDPEPPAQSAEIELRQLFGLTSCEARLANLLMNGEPLSECCDRMGIRSSTARMHLGNLFAKTGVKRQGQLVSLLLKSIGLVQLKRDSDLLLLQFPEASVASDRESESRTDSPQKISLITDVCR